MLRWVWAGRKEARRGLFPLLLPPPTPTPIPTSLLPAQGAANSRLLLLLLLLLHPPFCPVLHIARASSASPGPVKKSSFFVLLHEACILILPFVCALSPLTHSLFLSPLPPSYSPLPHSLPFLHHSPKPLARTTLDGHCSSPSQVPALLSGHRKVHRLDRLSSRIALSLDIHIRPNDSRSSTALGSDLVLVSFVRSILCNTDGSWISSRSHRAP